MLNNSRQIGVDLGESVLLVYYLHDQNVRVNNGLCDKRLIPS